MKIKSIFTALISILFTLPAIAQSTKPVQKDKGLNVAFVNKEAEKQVDVMIDGKLFTSYCWYDNVYKPVLYPVYSSAGTVITRGFRLIPGQGNGMTTCIKSVSG